MLFCLCCCYCYPFLLYFWKLLAGWLQHKHIRPTQIQGMFESYLIRWEKNEAPGPSSQGSKQRQLSTEKRPHCNAVHTTLAMGGTIFIRFIQVRGRVGPYLSCISQWERPTSHETWEMQAFLRTHPPALGGWRAGSAFYLFQGNQGF